MSSTGFRPLLTSWLARRPRIEPFAPPTRTDAPRLDPALGDWLYVEDATSRWLRTTQGAELG